MKVTLLTNLGSNDFPEHPFLEGETHEVTDEIGTRLVRGRLAVDVTEPVIVKAVAESIAAEPENNVTKMRAENVSSPKTKPASK